MKKIHEPFVRSWPKSNDRDSQEPRVTESISHRHRSTWIKTVMLTFQDYGPGRHYQMWLTEDWLLEKLLQHFYRGNRGKRALIAKLQHDLVIEENMQSIKDHLFRLKRAQYNTPTTQTKEKENV